MKVVVREARDKVVPVSPLTSSPWTPVLLFAGVAAAVWIAVLVAGAVLPRDYLYPRHVHMGGGRWVEGWMRWDAGWYREIVRHGYQYYPGVQSSVAYFPAYPLAMMAAALLLPVAVAGVVVTAFSGLAATVLFHRWCSTRMSKAASSVATAVLLVYPFSWYLYGAVYSDAFFLLAVMAAFILVERDQYWLAGIAGLVATASRPTGIALAIALCLRVAERRYEARVALDPSLATPAAPAGTSWMERLAHLRLGLSARFLGGMPRRAWPVLVSFVGLAAWSAYLWHRFGDPLLFVHIESAWHQGAGPRTWFKFEFFRQLTHLPGKTFPLVLLAHAVAAIASLALVPRIARRFGWSYGIYVLIVMGIPVIGTKDFMSSGRYLLAAFPVFALVGELLAERATRTQRRAWLTVSSGMLVTMSALWAVGKYLA